MTIICLIEISNIHLMNFHFEKDLVWIWVRKGLQCHLFDVTGDVIAIIRMRPQKPRPRATAYKTHIKFAPSSKVLNVEHKPKVCSPSPVLGTSPSNKIYLSEKFSSGTKKLQTNKKSMWGKYSRGGRKTKKKDNLKKKIKENMEMPQHFSAHTRTNTKTL